jgi:hypothetical protein
MYDGPLLGYHLNPSPQNDVREYYNRILAATWAPSTGDDDDEEEVDLRGLVVPDPPTANELVEYEKHEIGGPALDNFRLDFREAKTKGPWNREAARVFAEGFLRSKRYMRQKRRDVENSFLSHLRSIRARYQHQPNKPKTQAECEVLRRTRRRNRRTTVRSLLVATI